MGSHVKLAWIALVFCLGLIALAHCIPVEVVYTGEGCDCPAKLDFAVNVPSVPKPKKYTPSQYGYKIEVPPCEAKAKVSYSFDFTVEEPSLPQPVKPTPSNLFAMIDRIAIKKGDCEAPATCLCGKCAAAKPLYRYVLNPSAPTPPRTKCMCQRQNCKCNLGRTEYSPNAIFMGDTLSDDLMSPKSMMLIPLLGGGSADSSIKRSINSAERNDVYVVNSGGGKGNGDGDGDGADLGTLNIRRRKRDLQRSFYRPRSRQNKERSSRFVKMYHRNLANAPSPAVQRPRLFDFEGLLNNKLHTQHHQKQRPQPMPRKTKRKAKKTPYAQQQQRSRLVKREIKGEYDLLEKEREQMDLTLPEIIQFMPETLQPNFNRGQCYYGCGSQRPNRRPTMTESNENNAGSNLSSGSGRGGTDSGNPNSNEDNTKYNNNNNNNHHSQVAAMNNPPVFITYTDNDAESHAHTDSNTNHETESNTNSREPDSLGGKMDIEHIDRDRDQQAEEGLTNTDDDDDEDLLKEANESSANHNNNIGDSSYSHTKRNAANYHEIPLRSYASSAESAYNNNNKCRQCSSSALLKKRKAYNANLRIAPTAISSTNPNYAATAQPQQQQLHTTENAYSAIPLRNDASAEIPKSPRHYCSRSKINTDEYLTSKTTSQSHKSYNNNNDEQHYVTRLRYASNLDVPPTQSYQPTQLYQPTQPTHPTHPTPTPTQQSYPHETVAPVMVHEHSVQFIDNQLLDKIIADIIYSHPAFLDATSHLGGAMIDPESWQEQEAIEYSKHLIDDQFKVWLGKENKYTLQHHIPVVPRPAYGPIVPQLHDLLPPLY